MADPRFAEFEARIKALEAAVFKPAKPAKDEAPDKPPAKKG